ncbi:pantoate--beta-alanine ligase, partial [Salmonella enterica subsp. enterica]|nr:pantoate--beta-alanine ligase [Salmonella enterica subsp. enterica serovar Paratyphi A]
LAVIRQFVKDLNIPVEVIGVLIARAEDGLALSSRNGYLTEDQRKIAPTIYQSLKQAEKELHAGHSLSDVLQSIKTQLTAAGFVVDYVEARQPNLQPIEIFNQDIVLFVAAKLGSTRLIDNLQVQFKA